MNCCSHTNWAVELTAAPIAELRLPFHRGPCRNLHPCLSCTVVWFANGVTFEMNSYYWHPVHLLPVHNHCIECLLSIVLIPSMSFHWKYHAKMSIHTSFKFWCQQFNVRLLYLEMKRTHVAVIFLWHQLESIYLHLGWIQHVRFDLKYIWMYLEWWAPVQLFQPNLNELTFRLNNENRVSPPNSRAMDSVAECWTVSLLRLTFESGY